MKQRIFQVLLYTIVVVLATGWAGLTIPLRANTAAIVRLEPADVTVAPGEIAEISVWIDDAADLYGAEIHMGFDPAVLRIVDADTGAAGVQIQPGFLLDPTQGFVAANQVDHERGEVVYALTLLAPATPASGSGELARFSVEGIAAGRSEWRWGVVILANRQGEAMPVEAEAGSVLVSNAEATEQPTGTPPAVTPTSPPQTPASVPTSSPVASPTSPAPSPTSSPAGTSTLPPPETREANKAAPTQVAPTQTAEPAGATLGPAPGGTATPESLSLTTVVATPEETTKPVQAMPTGGVSSTSAEEGAPLSALPAVLAALVAGAILLLGRRLLRRRD